MGFPTITEQYGSLSATGLSKEVTFGLAVAPTNFQPMNQNNFEFDPGWFSPEVMQAVRDKQIYNLYGEAHNTGSIGGPLFPTNGIPLLVYAIGTDVVTGTVAPYCVDEQTEILTTQGWKTVHQLRAGEEVLTYNHDTGLSEWQPVQEVCVFPTERRELVRMHGRGHSSLTTPNHRWPVLNGRGRRVWKTTETLAAGNRVPVAAYCADLPQEAKYTDAFVELVAWFWTEGDADGRRITQGLINADNVDRIDAALRAVMGAPRPLVPLRGKGIPAWNRRVEDERLVRFNLNADAAALLNHVAPRRVVGRDFLRSLTRAQLDLFIEVSMRGDSCGPTRLAQKSREMAEAFQFAAILAGHATSLLRRTWPERDGYEMWTVTMRRNHRWIAPANADNGPGGFSIDRIEHDGIVWCPRTPNATWYARRDGQCYFTGNTHTITQANLLPSVTIEKNIGNFQSLRFAGTRIGKYQLKCAAGNTPAELTVDGTAQSTAIVATPAAVSVVTELPFVFAEATLTLFGNARAEVNSVSLTIENGLKETYTYSGSHNPSFITPVTIKASGQIDLVWSSLNNVTYGDYTSMVNGTLGALSWALAHPVAANGSVTVNCPQVVLSKYGNDLKIGDVVMSTLNFEASKPLPSGNTINAVITNGVSTAY